MRIVLSLMAGVLVILAGCATGGSGAGGSKAAGANMSHGEWQAYDGFALQAGREYVLDKVQPDYSHVIEITDHKTGVASLKATRGEPAEGEQPTQMDTFMFVGGELFVFTGYRETKRSEVDAALAELEKEYGAGQETLPEDVAQYKIHTELDSYLEAPQLLTRSWFDTEHQRLMMLITTKPQEEEAVEEETPADAAGAEGEVGEPAAETDPADEDAMLLVYLFDLPVIEENYEAFTLMQ